MKTLIFILLLLLSSTGYSQIVDIPDANFLQALIDEDVDTNGDGLIQVTEAESVTELVFYERDFASIEGVNSFVNLKTLDCNRNELIQSIDIHNLDSVTYLSVRGNTLLTNLNISVDAPFIDRIEVESNTILQSICLSNFSSNSVNIESNNSLSNIKLAGNTSIRYFLVEANPLLTEIDFGLNPNIIEFMCKENDIISFPDFDDMDSLRCLWIHDNSSVTSLNIEGLDNLYFFSVYHEVSLTSLNIANVPHLGVLNVESNDLIAELDLGGLTSETGNINGNTSQPKIYLCGNKNLKYLNVIGMPVSWDLNIDNSPCSNCTCSSASPSIEWICASPDQLSWLDSEMDLEGLIVDPYCSFIRLDQFTPVNLSLNYSETGDCDNNPQFIKDKEANFSILTYNDFNESFQPEINNQDQYSFNLPPGNYEIVPQFENAEFFNITPKPLNLSIASTDTIASGKFCVSPSAEPLFDCAVHIIPLDLARPGFEVQHKVVVTNNGNNIASGQVSYSFDDSVVTFVSANSEHTVNEGTVSINYEDLLPFESQEICVTLRLNSPMDNPPLDGDEMLYFKAELLTDVEDSNPIDNQYILCEEVRNAYDPNDKTCLQGPYLLEEMIGDFLSFRIRFENIGNASAVNVRVIDEIDPEYFDISTLKILESSHSVSTLIQGDVVAFLFDGIYLPFEDESNDGFVIFEVKTWDDLEIEDQIENTAEIYFDFNFPIITNTTTTSVVTDTDMDGYVHLEDCDDNDASVNPDQVEVLYNGIDEDCDPITLDDDLDQDGFNLVEDCDDNNPNVNINQVEELYNGIDDDCNPETLDDDFDQDGYNLAEDCDDNNSDINPSADDIPNNGIDENCDGEDAISSTHELNGETIDIYPNPVMDFVHIATASNASYRLTLYNSQGSIISQELKTNIMDCSLITDGIYFLKVTDLKNNKSIVERVVVSN